MYHDLSSQAVAPSTETDTVLRQPPQDAWKPEHPQRFLTILISGLAASAALSGLLRRKLELATPSIGYLADDPGQQLLSLTVNSLHWGFRIALLYVLAVIAFKHFRIHERFGFFGSVEPESHYWTALRNWRNAFLWGVGITLLTFLLLLDNRSVEFGGHPRLLFSLPEPYVVLHSPNLWTDLLYAIVGFYLIDLTDWAAHRLNHAHRILYRKFPWGHFIHHNHLFLNPFVVTASPFVHLAAISGFIMYGLLLSQGLVLPVFLIHLMKVFTNFASHLGSDPFPWLSRLNYRIGGWIPWIPLHHQYHHVPGATGNYGNLTSLWDHVFGTLTPDYVTHVTTGRAPERILRTMQNHNGAIDRLMRGKTRLSLD